MPAWRSSRDEFLTQWKASIVATWAAVWWRSGAGIGLPPLHFGLRTRKHAWDPAAVLGSAPRLGAEVLSRAGADTSGIAHGNDRFHVLGQIGRASCRERV